MHDGVERIALTEPYHIVTSGLARDQMHSISLDVFDVVRKLTAVLRHEPKSLCVEPVYAGSNIYSIGVADCPGGAMAISVSLDEPRKEIRILEFAHPVNLKTID